MLRVLLVVMTLVVLVGCGGDSETVSPPDVDAKAAIRAVLQPVADGQPGGSELGAMAEQIRVLKESDAALGGQLEQDHEQLMELVSSNPKKVAAKAKEMLAKLGGGGG